MTAPAFLEELMSKYYDLNNLKDDWSYYGYGQEDAPTTPTCSHKIVNVSLFFIINACAFCGKSEEEITNEGS